MCVRPSGAGAYGFEVEARLDGNGIGGDGGYDAIGMLLAEIIIGGPSEWLGYSRRILQRVRFFSKRREATEGAKIR
jgi:hypothetical protein